jgi:hypothetical protein
MAGATNRQYKAAGLPKATIKVIRTHGGAGMSLRSAIQVAQSHGAHVPEKALKFLERRAPEAKENPAAARMKTAKANVEMLRTQRDERRARMKSMRRKVEFARETKQLHAAYSPEHQRAVERAEMGHGPKQARFAAKMGLRDAKDHVRIARRSIEGAHNAIRFGQEAAMMGKPSSPSAELGLRAKQFLRDAPNAREQLSSVRERLAKANASRQAARKERRHATLVNEGRALRDMAEASLPLTRRSAKTEHGFAGVSKAIGPSNIGKRGAFNSAKHLAKRIALGEKLAQKVMSGEAVKAGPRFLRNLAAIQRMAPKNAATRKKDALEHILGNRDLTGKPIKR